MNWFYNLKIMKKLVLGFSITCATMAAIGAYGIVNMCKINDLMTVMYQRDLQGVRAIERANTTVALLGRSGRQMMLDTDPVAIENEGKNLEKYCTILEEDLAAADKTVSTPAGRIQTRVVVAPSVATAILDVVRSQNIDVVAMATHGHGGLRRFLLGSVADKLVRGSSTPVLVYRPVAIRSAARPR